VDRGEARPTGVLVGVAREGMEIHMVIKAEIRLSRVSGGDGDDFPFRLYVKDDDAGVQFFEARLTSEQFADLLSNRGAEVDLELRGLNLVGTMREYKKELVPMKDRLGITPEQKRAALKKFEVDGWIGDESDLTNHHRWREGNKVEVGFHRHVPKK